MRVSLVFVALLLLSLLSVHAAEVDMEAEDEAPVPEGFSLPNIFNPVLDRADGRDQAKTLVQLVAKEPKVAYGVGGPEAAIEDLWNGEKDPESSASVAQKKMLREVDQLTKLIDQGKKILKVLPRKEKRLALLKKKLSKILDAKAKRIAGEQLDQQQAILDAIQKREQKMSSRLKKLRTSQSKLKHSVKKLKKVISGKGKKAKKAKKAHKGKGKGKGKHKKNKKHHKEGKKQHKKQDKSLLETEGESDAEAELEAEAEAEAEQEQEVEGEQEQEDEAVQELDAEADQEAEAEIADEGEATEAVEQEMEFEAEQ